MITRKPGAQNNQIMAVTGGDTFTDGEFQSPYDISPATTAEGNKSMTMLRTTTFRLFTVMVQTNNNTVDGANFQFRNNLANGNEIVTIDQATGAFQDVTNVDTVDQFDVMAFEYNQGDNSAFCRTLAVVASH